MLKTIIFYLLYRRHFCSAKYTKKTRIDGKVVVITGSGHEILLSNELFFFNHLINHTTLFFILSLGGNTGLGLETAVDLAKRGGKIYIACRDKVRAENALIEIWTKSGSDNIHIIELDLSSLESVKNFSKKFHELENRLDILINNAGVFGVPQSYTKDGFETHMGVNHLGHFLLTNLVLDLLRASAPSRIIIVSSDMHANGSILKHDLMLENSYNKFKAYSNSKLANVLHGRHLAKLLEGTGVTVNVLHPGFVNTEAGRHNPILFTLMTYAMFFRCKTVNEGVQTQIMLACDPELINVTGKYFVDCEEQLPSKEASDDELAEWLWNRSMELVNNSNERLGNKI